MQDWLVGIVGENLAPIVSIVLAALLVILLALIVISLLRRVLSGRIGLGSSQGPRVEVVDVTGIDQKRKLVLVRRDQVEHLILIGGQNDLLIESNIGRLPPPGRRAEPGFAGQPEAQMPQPGEPPRRPQPPQTPIARVDAPRTPVVEPRAARADPAAAPIPPRRTVNDGAHEGARAEPVFAPPSVKTPTAEDRLDEAPRADAASAPLVEPQGPMSPARPTAGDARGYLPATAAYAAPAVAAPSAPPRPRVVAPPQPRPLATPTMPLRRTNPVAVEYSDPARAPEDTAGAAYLTQAEGLQPDAPVADRHGTGQPLSHAPAAEALVEPRIASRRVEPTTSAPPTPGGDRPPLTVRSFASAIQERPGPVLSPPPRRPAASTPPVAAPPVILPTADRDPSSIEDSELAEMLSAELAADDAVTPQRSPAPQHEDTAAVTPFPDRAAEQTGSGEMSLEEEMERLLRDFSQHTADRR